MFCANGAKPQFSILNSQSRTTATRLNKWQNPTQHYFCFLYFNTYICNELTPNAKKLRMKSNYTIGEKIHHTLMIAIIVVSLLVVGAIVIDYGFVLHESDANLLRYIYTIGWWAYIISFTLQLIFRWSHIRKKALSLTTLLGVLLYTSILPEIFPAPDGSPWLTALFELLESKYFVVPLLGLFAVVELSRAVTRVINKHTNPALLVVAGFALTIIFGALLLMFPRSTMPHINIPVIDALFTSASAVCVTGLSTVDVVQTFTLEGQVIIALLIQIGGLGIMTITTFFAIFFMDGMGLYSQFALKDMLSSGAESLISTLLNILGFTIVIELIGAMGIWLSIHPLEGMTLHDELFFAGFHAISAFCNAGFSTISNGLGNEVLMNGHYMFYIIISLLIVLGGIGFPILINLKKQFTYVLSKLYHNLFHKGQPHTRYAHITNVNTKLVLCTTLALILLGTLCIFFLERNAAFADMPTAGKWVHSFFNAIVPRTAGFNSVAISDFSRLTIILIILLMWVGGASQSTAGGIKVNTLAVALASIKSLIKGHQTVEIFNREITHNTIRRALVVIVCSVGVIAAFFIGLLILEPHLASIDVLFETVSAFSTVGLSMGITPYLSSTSKFLLVLLMFIGRVGFITVMMSLLPRQQPHKYRLPKEDIIIN